ncbi:MAG: VWA domain-containing protein, partial [Spirochaetota bacterium]
PSKFGIIARGFRTPGDEGFFFINVCPGPAPDAADISEKDIAFVLDASGSMAGEKLDQAKKALSFCVSNLNKGDRFQIIRFSTEADALFESCANADEPNKRKALAYISSLKAAGGTNIEDALKRAIESQKQASRPYMIVLITDGKPTIGETNEDLLVAQIRKMNGLQTRIFTFGIGYDVNTHMLDKLTELTRAYRSYVLPKEDLELRISDFYTKIQSPVLTDISLTLKSAKAAKTYPKDLPDLFAGSTLTVFGRYGQSGKTEVVLEGKIKGKSQKFFYMVDLPEENAKDSYIPALWASRRVGYLLDQIRLHGESREVIDEITVLARIYGIITPYTSYLILEDEARRLTRGDIRAEDQTLVNALPASPSLMQQYRKEMSMFRSKSGEGSVSASESVQAMNDSENTSQMKRRQQVQFTNPSGAQNDISGRMKSVQGRSGYNAGRDWNDPQLLGKKNLEFKRIKFASQEYFDF